MSLTNSRCERDVGEFFPQPGTPANVGPLSYNKELDISKSPKRFLPPAHVHTDNPTQVPFQNTDKRPFQIDVISDQPGPDGYTVRRELASSALVEGPFDGPLHVSRSAFRACSPRISVIQHVPGSSEHVAGSILGNPGPGAYSVPLDSIGKHPISFGLPLNHCSGERYPEDPAVGPGIYHKETDLSKRTTDFHCSETQRRLFERTNSADNYLPSPRNPAPGDYVPEAPWRKGPVSSFRDETIRTVDYRTCSPGPAAYPLEEEGMASFSQLEADLLLASAGFKSTSDRKSFVETQPAVTDPMPGPAFYKQPESSFVMSDVRSRSVGNVMGPKTFYAVHTPQLQDKLRETDGRPLHGFRSTVDRFTDDAKDGISAGDFKMEDSAGQSMSSNLEQRAKHFGNKGPFGTSEVDKFAFSPFDMSKKGGADPASFQHVDCETSTAVVTHNAFRSSSVRLLPAHCVARELFPSPAHGYDPLHKAVYRSQINQANTDDVSFGSAQDRFNALRDTGVPAPCAYDPRLSRHERGLAKSTEYYRIPPPPRSTDASGGVVGPGMYPMQERWLRKTHNKSSETAAQMLQGRMKTFKPCTTVPTSPSGNSVGPSPKREQPQRPQRQASAPISPEESLEHIREWMNRRRGNLGKSESTPLLLQN